jgi:hypothetical protein
MLFAIDANGVPSVAKVINISTANAPVITSPGDQGSLLNARVDLPIVASDPNSDPLTFNATGLPNGLSINPSTGLISGTVNTTGNFRTVVSVSDGVNSASTTFGWSVYNSTGVRYVRLEALSEVNGNPWASAAEINLIGANGAALSRTGWIVQADSEETQAEDGRVVNAFDGNPATIWHTQWSAASPAYPHWITINLGQSQAVTGCE